MKQSDSPSTLDTYWEEPDQRNTGNNSTNDDDPPEYVIDILGGAVSKTHRRLPESRNHRHKRVRYHERLQALVGRSSCGLIYLFSSWKFPDRETYFLNLVAKTEFY